jgi:starch phosphorylase
MGRDWRSQEGGWDAYHRDVERQRAESPGRPALWELALDLRWTWSHGADALWRRLDPALWTQTENPWRLLQDLPQERIDEAGTDPSLRGEIEALGEARRAYMEDPGWFGRTYAGVGLRRVAYFCMEFGLGEALPLYAGGLGVLAGDYLKAASDMGVPVIGIGLLYQEGYFRQVLNAEYEQLEVYPYNDPADLPIQPVEAPSGGWLRVSLEMPGRNLWLRVWKAEVGRSTLYLLDSNDPLNSPPDRGITGKLYGGEAELRLLQEIVLGIGGWRVLDALGMEVDICHLNEGHAAFAVIERARSFMRRHSTSFWEALWATRPGNLLTTHTSVPAGFRIYDSDTIRRFWPYIQAYAGPLGVTPEELVALGRKDPSVSDEPFNTTHLALRTCGMVNGVSRLHGEVSRGLFQGLFPRWPQRDVPVAHVTNGVHVPSWDSPQADQVWEQACGKERWRTPLEGTSDAIARVPDEELWAFRAEARRVLVEYVRGRAARQLGYRGASREEITAAGHVLDPNTLTLGFARRFTEYKRPGLLLHDRERLIRLLADPARPVQLVVAGKAHPMDGRGKRDVRAWAEIAADPRIRRRLVFLEDYDLTMAQELVRGVDLWINTPRRPWEACGTSGMKVLANGGLNVSELDGWWSEAFRPELGWALGDGLDHGPERDGMDAGELYRILEEEAVPEFYSRDAKGIPRSWIARMRASMASLAPRFSASRMVREYVESLYLPALPRLRQRTEDGGATVRGLAAWRASLERDWHAVRFGNLDAVREGDRWSFRVQVYLGEVEPDAVRVELYADASDGGLPVRQLMEPECAIPGAVHGLIYRAEVAGDREAADFTPRVIPFHPDALIPLEAPLIVWQR